MYASILRIFLVYMANWVQGGDGANAFGAVQQASNDMPPLNHDPEYDVLAAMVKWVESGIAPSSLTAVHYKNNTAEDGIDAIRPLCQVCLFCTSMCVVSDGVVHSIRSPCTILVEMRWTQSLILAS